MNPDTDPTDRDRLTADTGRLTRNRHDFSVHFAIPCDRHHAAWFLPLARQDAASSCASLILRRRRDDVIADDFVNSMRPPTDHYA